jgi:hypothetical protein
VDVALATWTSVARPFARADDVELLMIRREQDAVRIRDLLFGDDDFKFTARIPPIHIGRQLPFRRSKSGRLTQARIELATRIRRSAGGIGLTLVQLASIRRIGKPDAAVRMRNRVVG